MKRKPRSRPHARRGPVPSRLRLEALEDRLPPGDALGAVLTLPWLESAALPAVLPQVASAPPARVAPAAQPPAALQPPPRREIAEPPPPVEAQRLQAEPPQADDGLEDYGRAAPARFRPADAEGRPPSPGGDGPSGGSGVAPVGPAADTTAAPTGGRLAAPTIPEDSRPADTAAPAAATPLGAPATKVEPTARDASPDTAPTPPPGTSVEFVGAPLAAPPPALPPRALTPPPGWTATPPGLPPRDGPVPTSDGVGVQMSLSTDGNQSVILNQERQWFTLTLTVTGTSEATVIDVRQTQEAGGTSVVYMGPAGTDTAAAVASSGGDTNVATLTLRGAQTGSFQNDFFLTASIGGEDKAFKSATVIQFDFSPPCLYLADGRPVVQGLFITPTIAGVQALTASRAITPQAGADLTRLAAPQFSATDANGVATRTHVPSGVEFYGITAERVLTTNAVDNISGVGYATDFNETVTRRYPSDPRSDPGKASGYCAECANASPADTAGTVDPTDGEAKQQSTDMTSEGRGLDYAFRRVYRGHDYRSRIIDRGDFAANWTYSYADDFLLADGPGSTAPIIHYQDGQGGVLYLFDGNQLAWLPARAEFTRLRRDSTFTAFEIRDESGMSRVYHDFGSSDPVNVNGRLKEMRDRNGNRMTFHYARIDPGSGSEKFVLSHVVDTLGREIRYQYYAATAQTVAGRLVTLAATGAFRWGRLARVVDYKGNMDFAGPAESEDFAGQTNNRTTTFDYDTESNLVRVTAPDVTGTPTGNNFAAGKTTRYRYITNADLPGDMPPAQRARLLHKLTHVWHPNEVRNSPGTNPGTSAAAEVFGYEMNPAHPFFGYVTSYTVGGANGNGVGSGGTITYTYTDLNPQRGMGGGVVIDYSVLSEQRSLQVDVRDRNGNDARYVYGGAKTLLEYTELPRGLRAGEPAGYVLTASQNKDRLLKRRTDAEGDVVEYFYNDTSTDVAQQGNLIRVVRTPDADRGGDQPKLEMVYVYEPIYNRPCLVVFPRGADAAANGFTPPVADPAARTMADPYDPNRTLNLRYAKIEYFDYQESKEKAAQAPNDRLDKDGSGGRVNESPLIAVDPNVLTTEVWLLQTLGLSEDAAGLAEFRTRLSNNLTRLGLGDLNGDGDTTPSVAGNIVRTVWGSPVLLQGSNQHALEQLIDPVDLINQAAGYGDGGTAEGTHGGRLQTVVTMYQYNAFGQMTRKISPEGNVSTYDYFAERDADGDGHLTPAPADGRTLNTTTGGYLRQHRADAPRSYFDQNGNPLNGSFSNNNTNPAATSITTSYTYDDVGNVVSMIDGRGIRTDWFVNEHDEVVQTTRAGSVAGTATADPGDPLFNHPDVNQRLTAFGYLRRTFYDFNGNRVLTQVEDRGNTSLTDGSGLGALPAQATGTTPGLSAADPAGGRAFADTLYLYDRLDNILEERIEVDNTRNLRTRYRYDGNENHVLTIHPEGNADSAVYDDRDLLFQSTRGATVRPAAGRYAAGDPTTFNRPGGAGTQPSTTTYNYDANMNLIEVVDAEHNGGTQSTIAGVGDVTRFIYDGFNRRKATIDAYANRTTYVYDPDSNIVRVIQDGEPVNDGPGDANNRTLAVTEYVYDELSRPIATHRVLFQTPDAAPARTPTLTDTPAMDALTAYLADAGNDLAEVPGAIGIAVLGRITTLREYDRESRLTFTVSDDLDVRRTDYDGDSRAVKTTDSALDSGFSSGAFNPANLRGNRVEMAYDDNGNLIERKETDVSNNTFFADELFRTTYLYDALNRVQTVADNLGQTMDYRYDSRGNLVARADAVGPVTTRTINRRGLGSGATVTVNGFGNVTRSFYDGAGRLQQTETLLTPSGQGNGSYLGATLEGVKVAPPAGYLATGQSEDGIIDVHYAYDDNSQLLARRDDDGNTTAYVYDNQGRTLVERKGLNTGFQGTTFTIAGGDSGAFRAARRPPTLTDPPVDTEPAGTDVRFTYDRDGNVVRKTDEAGNVFDCTYDALNRRVGCDVTVATGFVGTTRQTYQYDGLSRPTSSFDNNEPGSADDDVVTRYFYDSLSRKVEEQQQIGALPSQAVSSSYDVEASGAVWDHSSLTYPDGRRTDNFYDALDRLERRRDSGEATDIGRYEYIGAGRPVTLTFQNGTRLVRAYDGVRRVLTQRWELFSGVVPPGSGTLLVGFDHRYDRADNKLIEEKLHDPGNSEASTYDSAYRLRTFNRGTLNAAKTAVVTPTTTAGALQAQTWGLDGLGNWTSNTHTTAGMARTEARTHSDFNEIVTVSGTPYGGATGTHVLDRNGNLLDDGVRTYQWDAFNRLRKVSRKSDGLPIAEYSYDSANRRMRKVVTNGGISGDASLNGTTDYYYDGWRVVEEHDATDAVTQQYTYGAYLDEVWSLDHRRGGISVAQLNDRVGGERHFYQTNALASVHGLTDETGLLVEAYQYDSYGRQTVIRDGDDADLAVNFTANDGRVVGGLSLVGNVYLFTGQRGDAESGLMYYKNRYYSTDLGRFVSRDPNGVWSDPIHVGNGNNYVGNNPGRYHDTLGLQTCKPKLVSGKPFYDQYKAGTLDKIDMEVWATPTDTSLKVRNWTWAIGYYVFWWREGNVDITTTTEIRCSFEGGKCQITTSTTGASDGTQSKTSAVIVLKETKNEAGDCIEIAVAASGALAPGSGPTVTAGKENVLSIGITWESAAQSRTMQAGTFKWCCIKEEPASCSVSPGSTGGKSPGPSGPKSPGGK